VRVPISEFTEPGPRPGPTLVTPAAPKPAVWPTPTHNLEMPEAACYGWAKRKTIESGCPPAWFYCGLLAIHAGQGVNLNVLDPNPFPTLYCGLIGPPESGKTVAATRACRALAGSDQTIEAHNPSSAEALSLLFPKYGPKTKDGGGEELPLRAATLVSDEMGTLIAATKYQSSTLAQGLNQLWSKPELGSASVNKGLRQTKVRLSVLGNIPAADAAEFREMWGVSTSTGLYSRFIFAPGPPKGAWDFDHTLVVVPEYRPPQQVTISPAAYKLYRAWVKEDPASRGRVGENGLRVAVISASLNGETIANQECMVSALEFSAWQLRVRLIYTGSKAKNEDATFTETLLEIMGRPEYRDDKGVPKWVDWPKLSRKHHFYQEAGATLTNRVRDNCVRGGLIENDVLVPDEEKPWIKEPTKRFRLVDITVDPAE
jgi:hypothetical protein